MQNTAQLEPFLPARTTVDGPPAAERNEPTPQYTNGFFAPENLDHLDAFQYSDDEDYIPPAAVKEEIEEQEAEPVEEKRPKRRSARSRKQKQVVQYDEDFDE